MNRFVCILISISVTSAVMGQMQRGVVRTLGRPDKKGMALSGVTIRAKGEHNAVNSKNDGTFSLLLSGKKNGDSFVLQQIEKAGYELNEQGVIGRQYAFSDLVPLTIVMVSTAQLQADKQRIEDKAYQVAENNYKTKLAFLEKQKDESVITVESYRRQLQELQERFEKYQSLIDGLAEHYAHVDYDNLNDCECEINLCIENGELDRADSLIRTLFEPADVLIRNKESLASFEQQETQARNIIEQANSDMAAVLKQQEKDAEYLYQLFTISLAKFDNGNAKRYIELRAALDTTNILRQYQAGDFFINYIADYDLAMRYFQKVLRQALLQYGEESEWVGNAYAKIGMVYANQGNYSEAMKYCQKVFHLEKAIGKEQPCMADAYNNCGVIYFFQAEYAQALKMLLESLAIREKIYRFSHPDIAESYNNLGSVYDNMGDYVNALRYYSKALDIRKKIYNTEFHPDIAESYNNIGYVYEGLGKKAEALDYYSKVLSIRNKVFGPEHPDVAVSYNNLAGAYEDQGDYDKAYECYMKAHAIFENVFDSIHPYVATSYGNLGTFYSSRGDYSKAMIYLMKSLSIWETVLGNDHPNVAISYGNIGVLYSRKGEYEKALEYHYKSLAILKSVLGPEHINVAKAYNNIGTVYEEMGDHKRTIEFLSLALPIYEKIYGPEYPEVLSIKKSIDNAQNNQ